MKSEPRPGRAVAEENGRTVILTLTALDVVVRQPVAPDAERTWCYRQPAARVQEGTEGWGHIVLWDEAEANSRDRWYDPIERLDPEEFYGLVEPSTAAEDQLLAAARSAGVKSFEDELARQICSPGPDPGEYCLEENPLLLPGPKCESVEREVLNLLAPSKGTLAKIEKFVRKWGIPEWPLPAAYDPLTRMLSRPAYPVLRFLYLAHEMHYVLALAYHALEHPDDPLMLRTANILRLLGRHRPQHPQTRLTRDLLDADARRVLACYYPVDVVRRGETQHLRRRALWMVASMLRLRLQHTTPAVTVPSQLSHAQESLERRWMCPDPLSAMWTVLYGRATGIGRHYTLAQCPGCVTVFLRDRRNRKYPRGHEDRCGKRVQRAAE